MLVMLFKWAFVTNLVNARRPGHFFLKRKNAFSLENKRSRLKNRRKIGEHHYEFRQSNRIWEHSKNISTQQHGNQDI
jgi:hypothetical protein